MRAELANINHCAEPFLSRAAVNLSWYDSTITIGLAVPTVGMNAFVTSKSLVDKVVSVRYNIH